MDKLRLYTPYPAMQKPILTTYFEVRPPKTLPCGLKVYRQIDRETGVHLTSAPNGLFIECNPTKFLLGNNYQMIDRNGLIMFTEALNERYQPMISFSLWNVSLFDFNSNIKVENKAQVYFSQIGGIKGWERTPYKRTGLNFKTVSNTKALTLYDLNLKCKKNGEPIPPDCEGKHIIRIEASFNKMLSTIKELSNMQTLNDYTQQNNYKQLPTLWLNTYNQIEQKVPLDLVPTNLSKKEYKIFEMIELYTLEGYRDKLKIEDRNNYRRTYQEINQLLEKIKQYRLQQGITHQLDELNMKVRERAAELILSAENSRF